MKAESSKRVVAKDKLKEVIQKPALDKYLELLEELVNTPGRKLIEKDLYEEYLRSQPLAPEVVMVIKIVEDYGGRLHVQELLDNIGEATSTFAELRKLISNNESPTTLWM